jgi:hypothetical protein
LWWWWSATARVVPSSCCAQGASQACACSARTFTVERANSIRKKM